MKTFVTPRLLPRPARSMVTALSLVCAGLVSPVVAASGAASVYSGQAIGVRIDGVVNPPGLNPIVICDTGSLPNSGGVRAEAKTHVSMGGGGLTVEAAGSLSTGLLNETVSAASLTKFHAEFVTDAGAHLFIDADYIGASASAGGSVAGKLDTDVKVLICGLKINGTPVAVTGQANQVVVVGESRIILNERASSADGKNADVSVAAIHFYTCHCVEGWLARVHAGFTLGDSVSRLPGCGG